MEEASRKVNQRYEMEEETGEIQSEKATPSTIAGFNDGGRGHKQCRRRLEAGKTLRDSWQGNSKN